MVDASSLKGIGALMIVLLGIGLIAGTFYLIGSQYKDSLCEFDTDGATYSGSSCQYSNGTSFTTDPVSVQKYESVEDNAGTVLTFLGIIVVVAISVLLIMMTRKISKQGF